MSKKGKKGFTLIEVLAVIVILGILSTIGIVTVVNIRKSQEEKFDQTQRELFRQTAKTYFSDNKAKLPIIPSETSKVYLQDLIDENYLDSLLDYNKNSYELDSYVEITKIGEGLYYYDVKLRKKDDSEYIPDNSTDTEEEVVKFNSYKKGTTAMSLVNGKYYSNKSVNVGISIKDSDVIMAYCYSIYRNGIKIYTSEFILGNNKTEMSDVLTLDLAERSDGKYKIELVVYDMKNHVKTKESDEIVIDRVPPKCGKINVTSGTKGDNGWYKTHITLGKTDGTDDLSGHESTTIDTKEIKKETSGTKVTLTTTDYAGNTCKKTETFKVDTEKPTCGVINVSGTKGNNGWYKTDVNIGVTDGKDTLSGHASTKVDTTLINTDTTGKVVTLTTKDKAGNECKTTQTIKMDKTPPTCVSKGGSTAWTNVGRTLVGECTDSTSKCTQNVSRLVNSDGSWTNLSPGTVYDNAGNATTCPANQTVRVDKAPPTCGTVSVTSGVAGTNGWYKSAVTASVACSDANCSQSSFSATTTAQGQNNLSVVIKDLAGNTATCSAGTYYVDSVAPTCGSWTGTSTSWTKSNRTISVGCSDTNSGCTASSYAVKTYNSGTTKTDSLSHTIYDNAGNSNTCSKTVNVYVDQEAPNIGSKTTTAPSNGDSAYKYFGFKDVKDINSGSGVTDSNIKVEYCYVSLACNNSGMATCSDANGNKSAYKGSTIGGSSSKWWLNANVSRDSNKTVSGGVIKTCVKSDKGILINIKVCDKANNCSKKTGVSFFK